MAMENKSSIGDVPSEINLHSDAGDFPAMFDDTRGYHLPYSVPIARSQIPTLSLCPHLWHESCCAHLRLAHLATVVSAPRHVRFVGDPSNWLGTSLVLQASLVKMEIQLIGSVGSRIPHDFSGLLPRGSPQAPFAVHLARFAQVGHRPKDFLES